MAQMLIGYREMSERERSIGTAVEISPLTLLVQLLGRNLSLNSQLEQDFGIPVTTAHLFYYLFHPCPPPPLSPALDPSKW